MLTSAFDMDLMLHCKKNCFKCQNITKTTICVHSMFCRYSELTIFMNNEQSKDLTVHKIFSNLSNKNCCSNLKSEKYLIWQLFKKLRHILIQFECQTWNQHLERTLVWDSTNSWLTQIIKDSWYLKMWHFFLFIY